MELLNDDAFVQRQAVFISDVIDLTVDGVTPFGGNFFSMPGRKLVQTLTRVLLVDIEADTFNADPTVSMGNDATTYVNMLSTGHIPQAALLNLYLPGGKGGPYYGAAYGSTAGPIALNKIPDLEVPPSINVSAPVGGVNMTACKVRFLVVGWLTPILATK